MAYNPLRPKGDVFTREDRAAIELPPSADLVRGFYNALASGQAGALYNQALDAEVRGDTANFNRLKTLADQEQQYAATIAPQVNTLANVRGPGDLFRFGKGAIGQMGATAGPSIALGTLGTLAAGPVGGFLAASVPAYDMEKGEAVATQYNNPNIASLDPNQRRNVASLKGLGNAALEALVPAGLGKALVSAPAKSLLKTIGLNALEEGATETAQQLGGFAAERYLDPTRQLSGMELADAAAMGIFGGGGMAAATAGPGIVARKALETVATKAQETAQSVADTTKPLRENLATNLKTGQKSAVDSFETIKQNSPNISAYVRNSAKRVRQLAEQFANDPEAFASSLVNQSSSALEALKSTYNNVKPDASVFEIRDHVRGLQQRRATAAAQLGDQLFSNPDVPAELKQEIEAAKQIGAYDAKLQRRMIQVATAIHGQDALATATNLAEMTFDAASKAGKKAVDSLVAGAKETGEVTDEAAHYAALSQLVRTGELKDYLSQKGLEGVSDDVLKKIEKMARKGLRGAGKATKYALDRGAKGMASDASGTLLQTFESARSYLEDNNILPKRITHKNLQAIPDTEVLPLQQTIMDTLQSTDPAKAKSIAQQLLAMSARMEKLPESSPTRRAALHNLMTALDVYDPDKRIESTLMMFDGGRMSEALQKIRDIPTPLNDYTKNGENSFFARAIQNPQFRNNTSAVRAIAEYMSGEALMQGALGQQSREELAQGLASVFGSKERALSVVDYYTEVARADRNKSAVSELYEENLGTNEFSDEFKSVLSQFDMLPPDAQTKIRGELKQRGFDGKKTDEVLQYYANRTVPDAFTEEVSGELDIPAEEFIYDQTEGVQGVNENDEEALKQQSVQDLDTEDGNRIEVDQYGSGMNEFEQPTGEYVFDERNRPFLADDRIDIAGGTKSRIRERIDMLQERFAGSEMRAEVVPYTGFLEEQGISPEVGKAQIKESIVDRINESLDKVAQQLKLNKKLSREEKRRIAMEVVDSGQEIDDREISGRVANIAKLRAELERLYRDEVGLDNYRVIRISNKERNPLKATSADLEKMANFADADGYKDTRITFDLVNGKKMTLSAESMWKTWGNKEQANGTIVEKEDSRQRMKRLFSEAYAAVLLHPDVKDLSEGQLSKSPLTKKEAGADQTLYALPNLVLDTETGTTLDYFRNPDYRKYVVQQLNAAKDDLTELQRNLDQLYREYEEVSDVESTDTVSIEERNGGLVIKGVGGKVVEHNPVLSTEHRGLITNRNASYQRGVLFIFDATASKNIAGVTKDGTVYVNVGRVPTLDLFAGAIENDRTKAVAFETLGITPQQLTNLFTSTKDMHSFLARHQLAKKVLQESKGNEVQFERQAILHALTSEQRQKLDLSHFNSRKSEIISGLQRTIQEYDRRTRKKHAMGGEQALAEYQELEAKQTRKPWENRRLKELKPLVDLVNEEIAIKGKEIRTPEDAKRLIELRKLIQESKVLSEAPDARNPVLRRRLEMLRNTLARIKNTEGLIREREVAGVPEFDPYATEGEAAPLQPVQRLAGAQDALSKTDKPANVVENVAVSAMRRVELALKNVSDTQDIVEQLNKRVAELDNTLKDSGPSTQKNSEANENKAAKRANSSISTAITTLSKLKVERKNTIAIHAVRKMLDKAHGSLVVNGLGTTLGAIRLERAIGVLDNHLQALKDVKPEEGQGTFKAVNQLNSQLLNKLNFVQQINYGADKTSKNKGDRPTTSNVPFGDQKLSLTHFNYDVDTVREALDTLTAYIRAFNDLDTDQELSDTVYETRARLQTELARLEGLREADKEALDRDGIGPNELPATSLNRADPNASEVRIYNEDGTLINPEGKDKGNPWEGVDEALAEIVAGKHLDALYERLREAEQKPEDQRTDDDKARIQAIKDSITQTAAAARRELSGYIVRNDVKSRYDDSPLQTSARDGWSATYPYHISRLSPQEAKSEIRYGFDYLVRKAKGQVVSKDGKIRPLDPDLANRVLGEMLALDRLHGGLGLEDKIKSTIGKYGTTQSIVEAYANNLSKTAKLHQSTIPLANHIKELKSKHNLSDAAEMVNTMTNAERQDLRNYMINVATLPAGLVDVFFKSTGYFNNIPQAVAVYAKTAFPLNKYVIKQIAQSVGSGSLKTRLRDIIRKLPLWRYDTEAAKIRGATWVVAGDVGKSNTFYSDILAAAGSDRVTLRDVNKVKAGDIVYLPIPYPNEVRSKIKRAMGIDGTASIIHKVLERGGIIRLSSREEAFWDSGNPNEKALFQWLESHPNGYTYFERNGYTEWVSQKRLNDEDVAQQIKHMTETDAEIDGGFKLPAPLFRQADMFINKLDTLSNELNSERLVDVLTFLTMARQDFSVRNPDELTPWEKALDKKLADNAEKIDNMFAVAVAATGGRISYKSLLGTAVVNPTVLTPSDEAAIVAEIRRLRGDDIRIAFETMLDIEGSGEASMLPDKTDRLIRIARDMMANPLSVAHHEALHDFFGMLGGTKDERAFKAQLLKTAKSMPVMGQLHKLLASDPKAWEQARNEPEEALAYAFQFWASGDLKLAQEPTTLFQRIAKMFQSLFGVLSEEQQLQQVFRSLYLGKYAEPSVAWKVIQSQRLQTFSQKVAGLTGPITAVGDKLIGNVTDRVNNMNIPALKEVVDRFHLMPEDEGKTGELPYIKRRTRALAQRRNQLSDLLNKMSPEDQAIALHRLRTNAPLMTEQEQEIREYVDALFKEMQAAGVKRYDHKKGKWVDMHYEDGYFPQQWDRTKVAEYRSQFVEKLKKYVPEDEAIATTDAIINSNGYIELVDSKEHYGYSSPMNKVKEFRMSYVNKQTQKEFEQFMGNDLAEALNNYTVFAVRRAEYARSFGNNGEWIQKKLKKAQEQGATDEELALAVDAFKAMDGTYGIDLMSDRMRRITGNIMAYQNFALLPLALITNLTDAVGVGFRSEDMTEAWKAFKLGIKGLISDIRKSGEPDVELADLTKLLGIIDNNSVLDTMQDAYAAAGMGDTMKKWNQRFFELIGLEGWNRRMRMAAVDAGRRYLVRQATIYDTHRKANTLDSKEAKHAERALNELGLTSAEVLMAYSPSGGEVLLGPGDIGSNPYFVKSKKLFGVEGDAEEISYKLSNALFKFADGAVLRPSAATNPLWMADPRFQLIGHLKQFTFTFHNTLLRRAKNQLQDGRALPGILLLSYIPAIIAADTIRGFITGGVTTATDLSGVFANSLGRSGLLGIGSFGTDLVRDVQYSGIPGKSFLGPTGEHLITLAEGAFGRVSPEKVLARSIPGGAAIRGFI